MRRQAGLDRSAPTRLYRDNWPKPEMLVALGDVEALCGFREPDETYALFARLGVPAATELVAPLQGGGPDQLAEVFARVLGLPEGEREVVAQVVTAAAELIGAGEGAIDAELGRFARTAVELDEHYPGDPGVLAALLMNRMGFGRFEGLFLPAGNLHAYLHGIGVEIMANSDNVMRGGLTPKHVDVVRAAGDPGLHTGGARAGRGGRGVDRSLALSHAGSRVRSLAGRRREPCPSPPRRPTAGGSCWSSRVRSRSPTVRRA